MTIKQFIKELRKHRHGNPGMMFMCDKYSFYEFVEIKSDEYTNIDGTRAWWAHVRIKKVENTVAR